MQQTNSNNIISEHYVVSCELIIMHMIIVVNVAIIMNPRVNLKCKMWPGMRKQCLCAHKI